MLIGDAPKFRLLRYMAKPGWGPLLPLQGDAPKFCLFAAWPSQVGAPYYPYRGDAPKFCLFASWPSPVRPPYYPYGRVAMAGGRGGCVGWRSGGGLNLRTAIP